MKKTKLISVLLFIAWIVACKNESKAQSDKGIDCVNFVSVGFSKKEIFLLNKKNKEFNKPTKIKSTYFKGLDEFCYKRLAVDTTNNYGLWEVSGGRHMGSFYIIKSSEKLYFVHFISRSRYGQVDKDKTLNRLSKYFLKSNGLPNCLEKKILDTISSFY